MIRRSSVRLVLLPVLTIVIVASAPAAQPPLAATPAAASVGDGAYGAGPDALPPLSRQVAPPVRSGPGPRLPMPADPRLNGGYARPLPPQYYPLPHERTDQAPCPPWPSTGSLCWGR